MQFRANADLLWQLPVLVDCVAGRFNAVRKGSEVGRCDTYNVRYL